MPPTRKKEHKTLSDLLADDVRDYFFREGLPPDNPPQETTVPVPSRRSRSHGSNGGSKRNAKKPTAPVRAVSASAASSGSLRAGWAATPSSTSSSSPSYSTPVTKSGNSMQGEDDKQKYQNMQAERHSANASNGNNTQNAHDAHRRNGSGNSSVHSKGSSSLHRRHGSGSGSFHSRGSASSRGQNVSAADAEFLRRYAEEKELINSRMVSARPGLSGISETRIDATSGASSQKPYHSLLISPRPPTVAGSHRQGLPSIDNDDWEEDDRIERHDKRKILRKEARKVERHRRRTSSMGGDSHSIAGSVGSRSVVLLHNPEQVPITRLARMTSQGSVMSTVTSASVGVTPGSESSALCYSTGSSHAFMPELAFHARGDSGGTFVRRSPANTLIPAMKSGMGVGDGSNGQERYPHQETTSNGGHGRVQGKDKQNGHVRPLSYLSASSDSGKSGEPSQHEAAKSYSHVTGDSSSSPSIFGLGDRSQSRSASSNNYVSSAHSSSTGTYQHPFQVPDLTTRHSSTDGSDLQSALLGSQILESTPSGDSRFSKTNRPGLGGDYRQQQRFEDSSDGSHDSEESSDSSYSSDSYDGDSSSNSHTSSERRAPRYQNNSKGVTWEAVNFASPERAPFVYRDIEGGGTFNESDRLSSRNGPNYSSVEPSYTSKPRNKRNRAYNKSLGTHRLGGPNSVPLRLDDAIEVLLKKMNAMLVMMELFISNMPSLVGSLALGWASLGVDWFKWYEETFDACHPVAYHNSACVFSEFPGCFACETDRDGYQFFLGFHYLCSTIAFIFASFLVGKIIIAFPVVRDELANPTTAAPLGLLCMAFEKVFAGNFGYTGKAITFIASGLHTAVALWFIFISVVYKTLPEPSWFSNTTGIGLAAAKVYLYWTAGGYFLSGFSLLAFSMFYVISLYRIHANEKISLPVCWVQLSGPAVILYGFSIFSQPGSDEDEFALLIQENKDHFFQVHRRLYMPLMHTLFAFCMVSMASSLYLVRNRLKSFREKEFSPAHVSFASPLIAHANAMQCYRSSLNKFSSTPPDTVFKILLYRYWTLTVICGTVLLFTMTWKFLMYLPSWCQIDVEDDEMPPAPNETVVTQLLKNGEAGDEMKQNYVSAAVLQANESGALVRVLQDGKMKYVRSRRMPSMGFDPIMNVSELMSERDRLLQHVTYAANPSRDRGGMSSFDDIHWDTLHEPDRLRASSGRRKLDFLSFDASTMMRPS